MADQPAFTTQECDSGKASFAERDTLPALTAPTQYRAARRRARGAPSDANDPTKFERALFECDTEPSIDEAIVLEALRAVTR